MFFGLRNFPELNHQSCCFCIHVRTGTILIGMLHCFWHALEICLQMLSLIRPSSYLAEYVLKYFDWYVKITNTMKYSHGLHESNLSGFHKNSTTSSNHPNSFFDLSTSIFYFFFCWLLVYGAISKRPAHLLPYFCLSLFMFVVNLLDLVSSITGNTTQGDLRSLNNFAMENDKSLTMRRIALMTLCLSVRGYSICVVWDCYKYLLFTSRNVTIRPMGNRADYVTLYDLIHEFFSNGSIRGGIFSRNINRRNNEENGSDAGGNGGYGLHRSESKVSYDQADELPKYDDALKIPANAYAPPPYFGDEKPEEDNCTKTSNTLPPPAYPELDPSIKDLPSFNSDVPEATTSNTAFDRDATTLPIPQILNSKKNEEGSSSANKKDENI